MLYTEFPVGFLLHGPGGINILASTTAIINVDDETFTALFDELENQPLTRRTIRHIENFFHETQPGKSIAYRTKRDSKVLSWEGLTIRQLVSKLHELRRQGFTIASVDRVAPAAA
jgi:hypothetical protein